MASDTIEAPSVRCIVCRERIDTTAARFDKEQNGACCPDCVTRLRWAQAHLKAAHITGCAEETKHDRQ